MAKPLKSPPTKSALLKLRRQLKFLEAGYDLLERKRELLTRLVYERLSEYRKIRKEAWDVLQAAYKWLGITHLRMGSRMLEQAGLGLSPAISVQILARSSLGVEYPSVKATRLSLEPVSLLWTDTTFDQTRQHVVRLAELLAHLGEAETALRRMLAEQRKTQKRVNALRYNVIPRYRATVRRITAALEEEERNTLFQIRLLRERAGRA